MPSYVRPGIRKCAKNRALSKFIYYLYEKIDLKRYKAGSGVPTLNRNDVHDTMVFFPASRKEQELISAVLTYLDDLITLHQRKRLSIRQRSPVWS